MCSISFYLGKLSKSDAQLGPNVHLVPQDPMGVPREALDKAKRPSSHAEPRFDGLVKARYDFPFMGMILLGCASG